MPFPRVSAPFLASLAILAASTTLATTTDGWVQTNVTDANSELLYAALRNTSAYSTDISTFVCAYGVNTLETQPSSTTGSTTGSKSTPNDNFDAQSGANYKFNAGGCILESKEYVGLCPSELFMCPNEVNLNIFASSEPKIGTLKITSIVTVPEPAFNFND